MVAALEIFWCTKGMAYAYEGKKLLKQADNEHKETTKHHFLNQVLKFEKKKQSKNKSKNMI